ncbi:MAG: thiamine-phosphate diphosphorylase [Nitrospirae bacterium GWC2_46_6]|nr:MAG: thiamine-phosphate diphosphorylase [Nitrospirae bacterium GWC2_46_6]OGW21007.1 MAG: thiamine-phosphate diphosphorylase [Nitrospirae bacterium GWA2_46_11]OGW22811.1 MAG: thiamine-phosphate diphosphorylase [Nitrospirae bacterium GWB2_47_37]HAK89826.1 thiamine phosphate synthase [Nitrospiraceae bacterium]HCL80960.1 thiamine phosphate synthase [Nitrospiraceae bacterium]
MRLSRICFISDSGGIENAVPAVLKAGIRWIQYREKNKTRREMFDDARKLRELTRKFDACFIVNDYADIALAVDADGVHLGQDDLPVKETRKIMGNRIIGISTHNIKEALNAEKEGADYIGFGSIFPTATKEDVILQGLNALVKIKQSVKIPVIAIGGITADNVKPVFETGCAGVAVSSGLLKGNIRENAEKFLSAIQEVEG